MGTSQVRKVYYAHSISRHLYDQRGQYLAKVNVFVRPLAQLVLWGLKYLYESDLRYMDLILTNSATNALKLRELVPNVPVQILPPFVDTQIFKPSLLDTVGSFDNVGQP
jgi:glycosyltransferase involved in cell wall biosynthesis